MKTKIQRVRIENWSTGTDNPYKAPECMELLLSGEVYGHQRFNEGSKITSSPIQSVDGRVVTTQNTIYTLGEPSQVWIKWLEEHHPEKLPLDEQEPIKVYAKQKEKEDA